MFYHGITIENLGQSSRALEPSLVDPVYGRRRPALLWAEVTAGAGKGGAGKAWAFLGERQMICIHS